MNNIIIFDTCSILIMMIFLISIILRKQVRGRNNFTIFLIILALFVASVADALNGALENYVEPSRGSIIWMYIANYTYFISHNIVMPFYILYIYSSVDIWHLYIHNQHLTRMWKALVALTFIPLLINIPFSGIVFSISDNLKYQRGPLLITFYVIAAIFSGWGVTIVLKYRKFMNTDRLIISIAMFPIALLGVLIQIFFSHVLVEMFTLSLSFMMYMVIVRREENQIDPITGAIKYNEGIQKVSGNFATSKPISVILIKILNHGNTRMYLGQEHFDEYLRINTERYNELMRKYSLSGDVFYFGGGLYMCLAEGDDLDSARYLAMESMRFVNSEFSVGDFQVRSEGKVCLVRCPQDIQDVTTLLAVGNSFHETMPDTGTYHLFSDYKEDKDFKIRNELEDIISKAIKEHSFKMYYQPIYSISKKKFIAAEALIRLTDERYGPISPGVFIPASETNGMIHEIGDFVLEDVIKFVSENKIKSLGLEYIEMNLSASQCIEVDLIDKIKNLLDRYSVLPSQISLELTETAADINPQIVDSNIEALHDYGIRIALDDYGTGYSNIKRVTTLPIDQVKLDKSFVDMIDDKQMWLVIQGTINMLKEMGKEILVEGIEEEGVAKLFSDLEADLIQGCELMQGFYFCRPLPEEEFITFIKQHM